MNRRGAARTYHMYLYWGEHKSVYSLASLSSCELGCLARKTVMCLLYGPSPRKTAVVQLAICLTLMVCCASQILAETYQHAV